MDELVRRQLRKWPQRPPGVVPNRKQPGTWLRARPGDTQAVPHPFLKLPGSNRLKTVPDGLWLHFSPDAADPFVDLLCIEACSTIQNLLDKRSRFAPSVSSLLVCSPLPWLLAPAKEGDGTPRWRLLGMLKAEPTGPLILPVRDVRVVFGLNRKNYESFYDSQIAQPHEFFCPMEALVAEDGHERPAMRDLFYRASASANFMAMT